MKSRNSLVIFSAIVVFSFPTEGKGQNDLTRACIDNLESIMDGDCSEAIYVDENDHYINYYTYRNKCKNGLTMSFQKVENLRRLSCIGYYNNNQPTGEWTYFQDKGVVVSIIKNIRRNTDFLKEEKYYGFRSCTVYQAYTYEFDKFGNLESEGYLIFPNDDMVIEAAYVGIWTHYKGSDTTYINQSAHIPPMASESSEKK